MTLRCKILDILTTNPRFASQSLDDMADCARVARWLADALDPYILFEDDPIDQAIIRTTQDYLTRHAVLHAEHEHAQAVLAALEG